MRRREGLITSILIDTQLMHHAFFFLSYCFFWLSNIQKFVPLACLCWGDHAEALDSPG